MDAPPVMHPAMRSNQELWDELADINYRSAFYDVEGFKAQRTPLDPEVLAGVGDLTGKRVLHLQCHFGMDTLRLAMLARDAVGIDFSANAIGKAQALAAELGIAARFIHTNIYELPAVLDEQFDVVFTSYGVLGWLNDLAAWGQIVARYLRPGGRFFIIEGHPTMWLFDERLDELRVRYPYFSSPEPVLVEPAVGTYADKTATVSKTEYFWPHPLSEVFAGLLDAGLRIDEFREYAHVVWQAFPYLVEESHQRFVMPPERPQLPLMFSIRASKPAA